jgi:hypothetical protein
MGLQTPDFWSKPTCHAPFHTVSWLAIGSWYIHAHRYINNIIHICLGSNFTRLHGMHLQGVGRWFLSFSLVHETATCNFSPQWWTPSSGCIHVYTYKPILYIIYVKWAYTRINTLYTDVRRACTHAHTHVCIYTVTTFKYVEGRPNREAPEVVWNTSSYI